MPASDIVIKGAREQNLRDVSLVLPRNQLICLTGVSGSGKSSLAFDTPRGRGGMSRVCPATSGIFWGKCPSRQSRRSSRLLSKVCRDMVNE
jgi:excinuclease UvrABC ATPase subunit